MLVCSCFTKPLDPNIHSSRHQSNVWSCTVARKRYLPKWGSWWTCTFKPNGKHPFGIKINNLNFTFRVTSNTDSIFCITWNWFNSQVKLMNSLFQVWDFIPLKKLGWPLAHPNRMTITLGPIITKWKLNFTVLLTNLIDFVRQFLWLQSLIAFNSRQINFHVFYWIIF